MAADALSRRRHPRPKGANMTDPDMTQAPDLDALVTRALARLAAQAPPKVSALNMAPPRPELKGR